MSISNDDYRLFLACEEKRRKLKEKHHFYDMMKDSELASEVTLLPINDLDVDSAILFSDILVIPDALGLELIFTGLLYVGLLAGLLLTGLEKLGLLEIL